MTEPGEELREQFLSMETPLDVANLLDVSLGSLYYTLYLLTPKYFTFEIPKKSGSTRKISAPNNSLKFLQHNLNTILNEVYDAKPSVYGFVSGHNIVKNAKVHRKRKYVLNIDLEDFFPSIHFGRVRGMFMSAPYKLPKTVATILTRICCIYEGLPQGAPTSPVISNMICRKLDSELQRLAKKHRCYYTRYADDITFSTSMPTFPAALAEFQEGQLVIGEELASIIKENHFIVNLKKVRLQTVNQRQEVTGLTVNRFPNVRRDYIRQIRVMLHDWDKKGPEAALERHLLLHSKHHYRDKESKPTIQAIVRGKIEFLGMVRGDKDPLYHKFLGQLAALWPEFAEKYRPPGPPSIFLNYAREDISTVSKIFDMLELAGYVPWMDKSKIRGGDDWERKILNAIDSADLFIACLSRVSVKKKSFVQKEIEYALERHARMKEGAKFIVPLRLNDCTMQDELTKFHRVDYFRDNGASELRDAIQDVLTSNPDGAGR